MKWLPQWLEILRKFLDFYLAWHLSDGMLSRLGIRMALVRNKNYLVKVEMMI